MEITNIKYNWCLSCECVSDHEILYLDYFKNQSSDQLGKHIKTHVAELYDHFYNLAHCEQGGRIRNIIVKIAENAGAAHNRWDITMPTTKTDFDEYVKLISTEINKLNNEEIVKEFYGNNEYLSVRLSKLDNKKIFEIFKLSNLE